MKFSIAYLLVVLVTLASAWTPFKHSTTSEDGAVPTGKDTGHDIEAKFNPKELLESRKPEFYSEALVRLERLEDQPLCHRVAAQLLMKNCRGLDGVDKQTYQLNSDETQKYHIEAFTASLTVCEMEEVSFLVPEACWPFSSAAIYSQARDIGHLKVSREQTIECKTSIHQNPSNQHIWSNFVTSATVFCRAARSEFENDQHILLHKELVQNMAKFSEAVREDVEMTRKNMADNVRAHKSYMETAFNNANEWTAKIKQAFQSTSKDVEDVDSAINSIAKESKNAANMMKQMVKGFYESMAEVSAEQEKALVAGTTNVQRQMYSINDKLIATENGLATIADALNSLISTVASLAERVDASDTQSKVAFEAVANVTDALYLQTELLAKSARTASNLNDQLEHATENAQFWGESYSHGKSIPDWTFRAGIPVGLVAVGNFGHALSLATNFQLGFAGLVIGEGVVWARTPFVQSMCRSGLIFINFISSPREPSSVTQKARMEKAASTVATAVQSDLPTTADSEDPRPEMV